MNKSTKLTLLFVLIFLVGLLGYVTYINRFLNNSHHEELSKDESRDITYYYSRLQ